MTCYYMMRCCTCCVGLQLATREAAVLLDLLALATQHAAALDACLAPLFDSPEVLKLGFGLAGDLAKLAGSWPDVQAFREVAGVLDLRPLWVAYGVASRQQVRTHTAGNCSCSWLGGACPVNELGADMIFRVAGLTQSPLHARGDVCHDAEGQCYPAS
eukprot:GHRQ01018700.1.p1 GENE.GHRQ01018700.1~~GHRQ01018700.1.p1  ORF type:complete len:158 (+),score=41.33 GHRQ01018700.1:308-781(+)